MNTANPLPPDTQTRERGGATGAEGSGTPDHIAILLGLYNGGATIDAQMQSFVTQSHENWSLIVSDDASNDKGTAQVEKFAGTVTNQVRLVEGPQQGFAQNFLNLLVEAGPTVPLVALSDQDDVWLPDKLARAVEMLKTVPEDRPALYASRTIICDSNLNPLRPSPDFSRPPSFENALVQSIGGGNTMVLNRAALNLAQETRPHVRGIVAHDWWLYQLITGAGGQVVFDQTPSVLYRQHPTNLIGANDTNRARLVRIGQLLQGRFRDWNTTNLATLNAISDRLTPKAQNTLATFSRIRGGSLRQRRNALAASGVYRQTPQGDLALKLAVYLDRA